MISKQNLKNGILIPLIHKHRGNNTYVIQEKTALKMMDFLKFLDRLKSKEIRLETRSSSKSKSNRSVVKVRNFLELFTVFDWFCNLFAWLYMYQKR